MSLYVSLHIESAKRAITYFLKQPLGTLMIFTMLAIAMTLPLTLYLGVQSSKAVLDKFNEIPQITLYLNLNATAEDTKHLQNLIKQDNRIESQRFISKDEGLEEMRTTMGNHDIISMLDENPLPDVIIITPTQAPPEAISQLQNDLAQFPIIESTQMDKEWMQTLYQINQLLHHIFWFLASTLGLAFILVAHNTIRLQILSYKEEIEITKLLGAPSSFIRRPFLYQAAWQSILSALISLGLCFYLVRSSQPVLNRIFQPYGLYLDWRFFHFNEVAMVLLTVCLLGIGGAWIATTQHLLDFQAKKN